MRASLFTPPVGVESKGGDHYTIPARRSGKIVVACEEAKLPRYCFRAESRSFRCPNLSEKFSLYCFGASEATIFSKRGSPRSGSHKGCSLRSPYPTPPGICAEYSKMEKARLD